MKRNHKRWREFHETKDFGGPAWKTNLCQERRVRRVISPARRDAGLLWVIHVISSVRKRLPLITHLRAYRCVAAPLGDQPDDPRRGPPYGVELRQAAGVVADRDLTDG
jgi:hypothetical protein